MVRLQDKPWQAENEPLNNSVLKFNIEHSDERQKNTSCYPPFPPIHSCFLLFYKITLANLDRKRRDHNYESCSNLAVDKT